MPSPITIVLLGTLYIAPLLGSVTRTIASAFGSPKEAKAIRRAFALRTGHLEYTAGIYRDMIAVPTGLILLGIAMWHGEAPFLGGALLLLSGLGTVRRRLGNRRVLRVLRDHPNIHPQDFFDLLALYRSAWPPRGPSLVRSLAADEIDFRTGEAARGSPFRLLMSFHNTATLAWLALESFRISRSFGNEVFDPITRLWTTRLAANHKIRLRVTGLEELAKIQHNTVIALNHESVLDFALAFSSLGGRNTGRGERLRIRFLAAKDHFVDNPLLYSIMGIGRAMEQGGMVFVDRKRRGAGAKSIDQAVDVIRQHDVDVAIFPQGTRATAHYDAEGDPYGAGYYTTTRGPIAGKGFFRSGAARIAARLAVDQPVDILCAGLVGVGRVMPARTFKTYKNRDVHLTILPPIHLANATDLDINSLSSTIERRLRKATGVHQRMLEVWQKITQATDDERDALAHAMAHWEDADDPTGYALLDAILTMRPQPRTQYLADFSLLLANGFPEDEVQTLRERVGAHHSTR